MNPDGLVVVQLLLLPGSTCFSATVPHTSQHTQRFELKPYVFWVLKIKIQKLPQPSFLFASFHARLRFGKDYKVLLLKVTVLRRTGIKVNAVKTKVLYKTWPRQKVLSRQRCSAVSGFNQSHTLRLTE